MRAGCRRLRCAAGRAAGCALLWAAAPAWAAPWYIEPTISAEYLYQSNPQFNADERFPGYGELLVLTAPVDWSDERSRLYLRPTINAGEARGATGIGQHNKLLDLTWSTAFATGTWRVNGNYAHADLFGASNATDLGVFRPTGFSVNEMLDAGVTWHPSELGTLDVDAQQSRETFHVSAQGPTPYVDFRYTNLAAQYAYSVSERTQLLLSASGGEYLPVDGGIISNDRSAQVGVQSHLSESLNVSATLGRSQLTRDGLTATTSGNVYSVSATWTHPTATLTLTAKQFRQPGAFGDLTLETDLRANWEYSATERLRLLASAGSTKLEDTFVGFELSRRNYINAELAGFYSLTPQWRVELHLTDTHISIPATLFSPHSTAASSIGGTVAIARAFGRTKLT